MNSIPTKNAIVCMFDSWQFNYTGCYGNEWIRTPNFDRFAREGVLFENAYGEGMPTVPVRRAIHTGCATLHSAGWSPLRAKDTTIADLCWGTGIDTALIFDCPMYRLMKYGYTRGFDKVWFIHGHEGDHGFYNRKELHHLRPADYVSQLQLEKADAILGGNVIGPQLAEITSYLKNRQYWHTEEDQDCPRVMKNAVAYLEHREADMPFFLWVDNFDPHEPWDPPSVHDPDMKCPYDPDYDGPDMFMPISGSVEGLYTEEEMHHIRMLYAEKITVCDKWFGYLMDNVRRLGLEENTMIVLLSDHGEPLGNGEHGHGIMRKCRPFPYEELVHVPLMIKAPGLPAGKRVSALVQNFDITPTICNWLGIQGSKAMDGIDLWPLMTGETDKIRDWAMSGYYNSALALYTEDWSYIHWTASQRVINSDAATFLVAMDGNQDVNAGDAGQSLDDDRQIHMSISKEGIAALMEYQQGLSLDGQDQWTCTPGSRVDVPDTDELYDRHADPFQLHNVLSEHQEVAAKLLKTINLAIQDLKAKG